MNINETNNEINQTHEQVWSLLQQNLGSQLEGPLPDYADWQELRGILAGGDTARLADYLLDKKPLEIKTGDRASLQYQKYSAVSLISSFLSLMQDKGVSYSFSQHLIQSYIFYIDRCRSAEDIHVVLKCAVFDITLLPASGSSAAANYSLPVRQAVDYISDRLGEPLKQADIAGAAGMHPRRFSRTFRDETGLSLNQYIQRQRVNTACLLLQYSRWPISDISASLGFASASYFTQVFKEQTRMTPLAWRQSHLGSLPSIEQGLPRNGDSPR